MDEELEEIKELLGADFYVNSNYISFYWKDCEVCNIRMIQSDVWELCFKKVRIYLNNKDECLDYLLEELRKGKNDTK